MNKIFNYGEVAYVTLLTDDSYYPGVQVLYNSIRSTKSNIPFFSLIGSSNFNKYLVYININVNK